MKELVVISGKGGTGKTSLVATFGVLANSFALADCDVDAADLHLVLEPTVRRREPFSGGSAASVQPDKCIACGKCAELCRFDAISFDGPGNNLAEHTYSVDPVACEGCGVCAYFCESEAIQLGPVVNGEWFVSDTRCGPMVHARLDPGSENSGKLVSLVRDKARQVAVEQRLKGVLIDGSPGVGCPVIASLTGADVALIVAEPTLSGLHDFRRIADLTQHFNIETFVAVNKWEINPRIGGEIEENAAERGIRTAGRIRYDAAVTKAQLRKLSVVEHTQYGAAEDIRQIWEHLADAMCGNKAIEPLAIL